MRVGDEHNIKGVVRRAVMALFAVIATLEAYCDAGKTFAKENINAYLSMSKNKNPKTRVERFSIIKSRPLLLS